MYRFEQTIERNEMPSVRIVIASQRIDKTFVGAFKVLQYNNKQGWDLRHHLTFEESTDEAMIGAAAEYLPQRYENFSESIQVMGLIRYALGLARAE